MMMMMMRMSKTRKMMIVRVEQRPGSTEHVMEKYNRPMCL
jgi:hypothetical protein